MKSSFQGSKISFRGQGAGEYVHALCRSDVFKNQVAAHTFVPARPAQLQPMPGTIDYGLKERLKKLGFEGIYRHQADALQAIAEGRHTVVATPTASGKTLIYNLSVLQAVNADPGTSALYLFPLKALAQDQLRTFNQWTASAGIDPVPTAAIYDGDTSAYRRKKIRQTPPNVLITNPEMLHLALLPYHEQWRSFFEKLKFVVIDEVHTFRGMHGAHMAQVCRRLSRICRYYGATPTYIFASATVANPGELAARLTDLPVNTIGDSGAPIGGRHIVLIDALDSPSRTAITLLKAALARQLRTIVYTQSRKMAELIAAWARGGAGRWAHRISVYRAGLMPEDRRDIERQLKSGDLLAVVSTSALELGIDIGDLDLCILVGYPGSMIATWQRSGRVGRQGQEAAMVMIATENALDKYFIANPEAFWQGKPELAVLNPYNRVALEAHLECAAAEMPLAVDDPWLVHEAVIRAVQSLTRNGDLRLSADGKWLHSRKRNPHRTVNLRGIGEKYRIVEGVSGATIGEMDGHRLYRDTHAGAVYMHLGRYYVVQAIDTRKHAVLVKEQQTDYYTQVRSDTEVEIVEVQSSKQVGRTVMCLGNVTVTDRIYAYDQIHIRTGRTLNRISMDVPPSVFETQGIWFPVPGDLCHTIVLQGFDLMGSLHAAEHVAISLLPLLTLVDRNDLGGLSTPRHPQVQGAAIFVYDGVPGGAGFCEQAFNEAEKWLLSAQQAVASCPCDTGCPACVHSPKCGSGNHPIDKSGAMLLMQSLLLPAQGPQKEIAPTIQLIGKAKPRERAHSWMVERYGVFDLETQRSAQEVGGWQNAHLMRISCGVVYDAESDKFSTYMEDQVDALISHLKRFDLVVGFNSLRFDYKVLSGYSSFDFDRLPTLDLLEIFHQHLGFRRSLDHLAEETLGKRKSGSGLDALRWWRQGRIDKIVAYCQEDVRITRELFLFVRQNGYALYREKDDKQYRVLLY